MTCCSNEQIIQMDKSLGPPKEFLARCPSCLKNFIDLYCSLACDPDQSDYLKVTAYTTPNETAINGVDYVVSTDFAYGMYNSCKDVQMPSNNQRAIGALCGGDAASCTPQSWLDYMGSTAKNPAAPFDIKFYIMDVPYNDSGDILTPMNMTIEPCSTTCSCQDCSASCGPPPPPYVPPQRMKILNVDGFDFIAVCLFGLYVFIFGLYLIWSNLVCYDPSTYEPATVNSLQGETIQADNIPHTSSRPSACERMGASLERKFERFFSAWGRFCARHPYLVVGVGVVICAILSAGISMFQVTTDPVELWSAPDSRARQGKDYFDKNFR